MNAEMLDLLTRIAQALERIDDNLDAISSDIAAISGNLDGAIQATHGSPDGLYHLRVFDLGR